jgi:hypothetical protein
MQAKLHFEAAFGIVNVFQLPSLHIDITTFSLIVEREKLNIFSKVAGPE